MGDLILKQFIAAVNAHNPEQIAPLLSGAHTFIDANNNAYKGRDTVVQGWKNYFEWFPDYKIEVNDIIGNGSTLALFGFAGGTFYNAMDKHAQAHWRLPAAWKVIIGDSQIELWQVYCDTKVPLDIVDKFKPNTAADAKVTGIGGVFFKADAPKELCAWYDQYLGTNFNGGVYCNYDWREHDNAQRAGSTVFSVFSQSSDYFAPGSSKFMLNLRVNNLDALIAKLRNAGVEVVGEPQAYEYGKFGWIMDPEGNKVELWEPAE